MAIQFLKNIASIGLVPYLMSTHLMPMPMMDKIEIWSTEVLEDPEGENMMDNDEFVKKLDMYEL